MERNGPSCAISYRRVKHPRLEFRTGELLLVLPYGRDPSAILEKHRGWIDQKAEFIEECLRESRTRKIVDRSEQDFRALVHSYAEAASSQLGVKINRVFFREMKTKWASCSAKRNLTVNTLMKHLPDGLVEYVTYHEIAHLKEKRHNGAFWRIIGRKFENSAKLEKELFTYWFLIQHFEH